MPFTAEFKYLIGQEVKIKAIGMTGRVDLMSIGNTGTEYRVVYWNNGERHSAWLYDWELE